MFNKKGEISNSTPIEPEDNVQLLLINQIVDKLNTISTHTPTNFQHPFKLRWPKKFKLREKAFENYNWMLSFERCSKTNGVVNFLGKLDALGSLFSDHGEGWIRYPKNKDDDETWRKLRELYFKKFVASKEKAKENFKKAVIKPNHGPEVFLKELQMLADISGIIHKENYDFILKKRFCQGLANAQAYSALPFFGRSCKTVDDVLTILEEEELLDGNIDRDLSLNVVADCPFTKLTMGFHNRSSERRERLPGRRSGIPGRPPSHRDKITDKGGHEQESPICNNLIEIPDEEEIIDEYDEFDYSSEDYNSEEDYGHTTFNSTNNNDPRNNNYRTKRIKDSTPACTACFSPRHTIENCYASCRRCRALSQLLGDGGGEKKVHKATETCPLNTSELKKIVENNSNIGYSLN